MWTCPACAEPIEDTYRVCWQCGTTPEGTKDPDFQAGLVERDHTPAEASLLRHWRCPKCDHDAAEIEVVRASRGVLSSLLASVDAARFSALTCERCRYTELYKADPNKLAEILDNIAS